MRRAGVLVAPLVLGLGAFAALKQGEKPASWRLVERLIEEREQPEPVAVVLAHLAGVPSARRAAHGLERVARGLREPWAVPGLAEELRDLLARPVHDGRARDLAGLVPGVAAWLDLDAYRSPSEPEDDLGLAALDEGWRRVERDEVTGSALLEALSDYLATAHAVLTENVEALGADGRALLFGHHGDFCESWYRNHFPASRANEQATAEQRELSSRFIDGLLVPDLTSRARMLGVAEALLRLTSPPFLSGLRKRLAGIQGSVPALDGLDGDVLAVVGDSASTRVVLGGPRPTHYSAPAALVIDLGGNDTYARAAVAGDPSLLASVVIDLRGDDTYDAGDAGAPGPVYAAGGVAILVDSSGDDRYRSKRLGQAASIMGFALLADLSGDDVYELEDYGQGHSLAGAALLYDFAGDDSYEAWAFAQGAGIAYGLSALVDGDGADRYLADLHWPDVYGDSGPESHHGASQGYCTGLRSSVSGGVAALVDLGDGDDSYQSGNFSQGGGYFHSFGLMYDGGGDDVNRGYRYSQGFGVHQAVGVRWDAGGDDRYVCRSVAHAGMAWDEGVGWFLDDAGDDEYDVGALSLGAAAQTGVAVFIDGSGKDVYAGKGQSQGACGGSDYHGKPSLGVMIDLGGGDDRYSATGRSDGVLLVDEGVGVFLDAKARSLKRALRSKLPRK